MIIADKREKNSLIISELLARGIEVKQEILEVGDYIIGNLIIERKRINDFISSMLNKRLLRQLEDLNKTEFENKLIILEGLDEEELFDRGGLNNNAIRGMLLAIVLDYKIPIIFTKNYLDTCNYLEVLNKRLSKKPKTISFVAKPRFSNIFEQQEFIIESFPGIGKALAREILKKFKNIKNFINASEWELKKIKKLGEIKARQIRKLIEAEYKSKEEIEKIGKNNWKNFFLLKP